MGVVSNIKHQVILRYIIHVIMNYSSQNLMQFKTIDFYRHANDVYLGNGR